MQSPQVVEDAGHRALDFGEPHLTPYFILVAAALLSGVAPEAIAQSVTDQQARLKAIRAQREVCYVLAAADLNLADCLSFADAPEPLFRAEVCGFLSETEQLEDFKIASISDCIRYGFER